MITMIWAQGQNREIGLNNSLPWHLPEDLKHFKETTNRAIVVMGGNTYRSLDRPLPNRINVVLTRDPEPTWVEPGVWVYDSIPALLNEIKRINTFIIGGQEIYDGFMKHADRLIVTHIQGSFKADAFAPLIDTMKWEVSDTSETYPSKSGYNFNIVEYKKLKGGELI